MGAIYIAGTECLLAACHKIFVQGDLVVCGGTGFDLLACAWTNTMCVNSMHTNISVSGQLKKMWRILLSEHHTDGQKLLLFSPGVLWYWRGLFAMLVKSKLVGLLGLAWFCTLPPCAQAASQRSSHPPMRPPTIWQIAMRFATSTIRRVATSAVHKVHLPMNIP